MASDVKQPPRPPAAAISRIPPRAKEVKETPPIPLERYAELGDAVCWFPGADRCADPSAAIVTAVGLGSLGINVFAPHLYGATPQEGVMHMDDPRARTDAGSGGGGWEHQKFTLALRRLLFAAGILVWDGKQNYVIAPGFDWNEFAMTFVPNPDPIALAASLGQNSPAS